MKLTPREIQQQTFSVTWRGLVPQEVTAFLERVSEEMAQMMRNLRETEVENRRLVRDLEEHRQREQTMRDAMLTAQRAIDDMREQAQKEAQYVISEAELRAEKVLHQAHGRANRVQEDLRDLRRQRLRLTHELEGVLQTHQKLLELQHEANERESASDEATVTVLGRLRAPSPPGGDLEEVERAPSQEHNPAKPGSSSAETEERISAGS